MTEKSRHLAPNHSADTYQDIFRTYTRRSAEAILAVIRGAESTLSESEREQALHSLAYVMTTPDAWPITTDLLLTLAPQLEQAGYRQEWMTYLEQGIELCLTQDDQAVEIDLRFYLGVLYQLQSRFEDAYQQFRTSAGLARAQNEAEKQARALNRMALIARRVRRAAEAKELAAAALALASSDPVEQAYSHSVLAGVAYDRREWQRAHDLFKQALDIWQATGDRRMVAWGLTNWATSLRRLERYHEASDCYRQAITLFEQIRDPLNQALATMNLGNVHLMQDQFEKAVTRYQQAETMFRKLRDRWRLSIVYCNISLAYTGLQLWDQAQVAAQASANLCEELSYLEGWANAMDSLGLIHWEQDHMEEAAEFFRQGLDRLPADTQEPGLIHIRGILAEHLSDVQAQIRT